MKLRSFKDYLEKRLDKDEIEELGKQAALEFEAFKELQCDVSKVITQYMDQEQIGFNELVRRLGVSPAQVNLTLASLAHIAGLLGRRPHLSFA